MTIFAPKSGMFEPPLEGTVHIWQATIACLRPWFSQDLYLTFISKGEIERYSQFSAKKAAHEYLLGRLMMRTILSAYYPQVAPQAWHFEFNEYGKPILTRDQDQRQRLEFSISHSGGAVVLALTVGAEIGIDIETPRKKMDPMGLAVDVFSHAEVAALKALRPAIAARRFYEFWTLKEAYIKARGMGLSLPLDQFTFHLGDPTGREPITAPTAPNALSISIEFAEGIQDEPRRWWFSLRDFNSCPVALAVKRKGLAERVLTFDYSGLSISSTETA